MRGAVLQLLLVFPAAPGAVRSRDEAIAMRRAYLEAERRCAKTGLTLLRFDGGDESASSPAARAARSRVEAERFETELHRRGEGEGGRLMPHMGVLLAKLSNASLELALSSLSVASAEPDCMIYLPSHETPVPVPRRGEARRRRLGVLSAPPSWGLDLPTSPLHPAYISPTSPIHLPDISLNQACRAHRPRGALTASTLRRPSTISTTAAAPQAGASMST